MQTVSPTQALYQNFLGTAPDWYKLTILGFLVANPILLHTVGPYVTGWLLIIEFIFTLAMALKCYPLQSGGLLAIEAIVLGMAGPADVLHEIELNLPVILLLVFMVAGIYFMKDLLLFTFTRLLTSVQSKTKLSLLFCFATLVHMVTHNLELSCTLGYYTCIFLYASTKV